MSSISSEKTPFKKPKILTLPKHKKNMNQELLNIIENLKEENSQLKEALIELEKDSKEKDQSIEECQKIIKKLKEEYTKVVKEFELMENSYNDLLEEKNQKIIENSEQRKTQSEVNVLINNDKKILYKQNFILKKKLLSSGSANLEDENSNDKNKIKYNENLKNKNMNYNTIIKEKELIIENQNLKIKELNDMINKQNEKLKSMENNKNNDFNRRHQNDNNLLEDIFSDKNVRFCYDDLVKENILIPKTIKNESQEEINIRNNLRAELIKTELFSGLIRENHFINFIQKILEKFDFQKIKNLNNYSIVHKHNYLNLIQENNLLKKTNKILYKIILELKNKINSNNKEVKNKFVDLLDNINIKKEIFKKIEKKKLQIKNPNSSCYFNKDENIEINFNNCKNSKKEREIFKSQRIYDTLPLLENNNFSKYKKGELIQKSQNLSYENRSQILFNPRINTTINRKKKRILLNSNDGLDTYIKTNNSLDLNPSMIEVNKNQKIFNSPNLNLMNKTQIKNNNNKLNYKNEILNIKNEINSIISKNDNLYNSLDEINKTNYNIFKLKNKIQRDNLEPKIFLETTYKRNENIKYLKTEKNNNFVSNNLFFSSEFFVELLMKINEGIFVKNDLNKYKQIYNLTSYENIYLTFKKTCNELKNTIDEINLKINKSHYLTGSNYLNKTTHITGKRDFFDNSFSAFNEKIINLKKLEFEFMNMNEYIKNYLISQEATIQLMNRFSKKSVKFEPIEKLFNMFEDCLSYRINEMNENIKFIRKLLIKLFKNQINCLFLSLEYKIK